MKIKKIILLFIFSIFLFSSCAPAQNKLNQPTIFLDGSNIRWSVDSNASSYTLMINDETIDTTNTFYDTTSLNEGTYTFKVRANAKENFTSSDFSLEFVFEKTKTFKLASPSILINENIISWDAVENATSYEVYLDNKLYGETISLSYELILTIPSDFDVKVKAKADGFTPSDFSNTVIYKYDISYQTIEEVKQAIDENPDGTNVIFRGKVIGFDSTGYAHVADETGVIYIRCINPNLAKGNVVQISGVGFVYRGSYLYKEYTRQIKEDGIKIYVLDEEIEPKLTPTVVTKEMLDSYDENNCHEFSAFGNVIEVSGKVKVGASRYNFYLMEGNEKIAIHHYSTNFNNDITNPFLNVFLGLDGKEVTLRGILYRYYSAESIWTIQCIGLDDELIQQGVNQLATPFITLSDNILSWEAIDKADSYAVYLDDKYFATTSLTSIDLSDISWQKAYIIASSDLSNIFSSEKSNVVYNDSSTDLFDVNLFMINDTHGSFVTDTTPGIARVSTLIKQIEKQNGKYIKIVNGDVFQGTYVSNVLHGKPLIDALNYMNFDAFIVGNHDFDWGLDELRKYKDGSLENGEANFPFVCANIIDKRTNKAVDFLEPYVIVQQNNEKVGIIGLIGHNLESSILKTHVENYDFVYPLEIVKNLAKELRDKGCKSVVVAIHDYDQELNQELAALQNNEKIDAILCAHTHQNVYETITRHDNILVPVVQNRDKNQTATSLILIYQNADLKTHYYQQFNLNSYQEDDGMKDILNKYQKEIDEGKKILGTSYTSISRGTIGIALTNEMKEKLNVDVAIINTGGVRSSLSAGMITVANVFEIFPFDNEILQVELSGAKLKSLYESNGAYLYFNESFNANNLDSTKMYKIAVIDYVFYGDYYTEFKNVTPTITNVILRDLAIVYFDENY